MKCKRIMSLLLSLILVMSLLAACSSQQKDTGSNVKEDGVADSGSAGGAAEPEQSPSDDDVSAYFHSKDHYTLKVMTFGSADTDTLEKISEQLSVVTREKLNCDVELTRVGFSTYMSQLNLMLSSGDEFDLFVPMASPIDYVNAGQIQPVGELLEKFAPALSGNSSDDDWITQTFNNEIYGLPVNSLKGNILGFGMRKDICDELDIDYQNMSSWDELHDALVKVKENYPDVYPIISNGGNMFGSDVAYTGQDSAGDTYNLAVLSDPFDENAEIVNWYETEQFKAVCERMYQWAQEGLIMPDASTNTDAVNTLVAAGKGFGYFQHMKPGWEKEQSTAAGTEIVAWRYGDPTYIGTTVAWFVPTTAGDPERAVAFFDLMYSDEYVANLVINGVEGENYVVTDSENGMIDYPDGVDSTNTSYSLQAWSWPNQALGYFWEGDDTTLWEQYDAFDKECQVPQSFGFTFDATGVMNEITACINVYQKYVPALLCGSLDPDTTIETLQEEMNKAGIEKIVDEKQAQFDEWKANK